MGKKTTDKLLTENHVCVLVQVEVLKTKKARTWQVNYNGVSVLAEVYDKGTFEVLNCQEDFIMPGHYVKCEMVIRQVLRDGRIVPLYRIAEVPRVYGPDPCAALPQKPKARKDGIMMLREYRGYQGSCEFSAEDQVWYGEVLFIRDGVFYEAAGKEGLQKAFEKAVDEYFEDCRFIGKEPDVSTKRSKAS